MINSEQFEAVQQDANAKRETFMDSLDENQKSEFDAVEKAAKILINAGVNFYLFPYLPWGADKNKYGCWQWNSLHELEEKDEFCEITENGKDLLNDMQASFYSATYFNFTENNPECNEMSKQEKLEFFFNMMVHALNFNQERLGK